MTKKPRYRIILDFDGTTPPEQATNWVQEELSRFLPDSVKLDLELEEMFATFEELPDYLGHYVTVNRGTMLERSGILDQVFPMNEARGVVILEGCAVEINKWEVIYINEGGDYSGEYEAIPGDAGVGGAGGIDTDGEPDPRYAGIAIEDGRAASGDDSVSA